MQAVHDGMRRPRTKVRANKSRGASNSVICAEDKNHGKPPQKSPLLAASPIQAARSDDVALRSSMARGCLWVSELGGRVVGRVGLAQAAAQVARLCQFRMDPEWQHTSIPKHLVSCLQDYCWHHGCFKLVAEARDIPGWFRDLLERGGFRPSREATSAGQMLYAFYVDP